MPKTRKNKRAPVSLKVRFKSATVDEFLEQYSLDISRGGLFIKSKSPMDIGTLLKFELQLKDESRLIHGVGRVVWTRDHEVAEEPNPPGMGIKFIRMDGESRTLVEKIVGTRGDPSGSFETGPPTADLATIPPSAPPGGQKEQAFFPTTSRPDQLPKPEDRTQVRHASEFLESALSDADESARREAEEAAEQARRRTEEIERERRLAAEQQTEAAHQSAEGARAELGATASTASASGAESAVSTAPEPSNDATDGERPAAPLELTNGQRTSQRPTQRPEPAHSDGALAAGGESSASEAPEAAGAAKSEQPAQGNRLGELADEEETDTTLTVGRDAREPEASSPVVPILLAAVIIGAALWYFIGPGANENDDRIAQEESGQEPFGEPPAAEAEPAEAEQPFGEDTAAKTDEVLRVNSTPPGATVRVDGEVVGTTPVDVAVLAGTAVSLEVEAAGYKTLERTLSADEREAEFDAALEPLARILVIKSEPRGAIVRLKGHRARPTPAQIRLHPDEDEVSVMVRKLGYHTVTETVKIADFRRVDDRMLHRLSVELEPKPERSRASSDEPATGAGADADGEAQGTAPEPTPQGETGSGGQESGAGAKPAEAPEAAAQKPGDTPTIPPKPPAEAEGAGAGVDDPS